MEFIHLDPQKFCGNDPLAMLENTPEEFRESIGEYWGPELREKNYGFV
jgi:hypothetical protein